MLEGGRITERSELFRLNPQSLPGGEGNYTLGPAGGKEA